VGEKSKISWTDATFNPWWGCTKVSAGCENCYAIRDSARWGQWFGPGNPRRVMSEHYWNEPMRWNKKAKAEGKRKRVFCGSMCDICEDRPELLESRKRLQGLIEQTPNLFWMLLTKRPENFGMFSWDSWPSNVMAMTTTENETQARRRIPMLLKVKAAHGISAEPLLAAINLRAWISPFTDCDHYDGGCTRPENVFANTGNPSERPGLLSCEPCKCIFGRNGINWVIAGGESGPSARPMHPLWVRFLLDQCQYSRVPFFFKQWGEWRPIDQPWKQVNPKKLAPNECWLNGRGGSGYHDSSVWRMRRVGKDQDGAMLDGRTWEELPI
jgi:protein gp37